MGKVLTKVGVLRTPKSTEPVNAQSAIDVTWSDLLAAVVLCLVELRGFEHLTPCMPSRDPTTNPRVAGHAPAREGLACGSCGFVEQSCCASARRHVPWSEWVGGRVLAAAVWVGRGRTPAEPLAGGQWRDVRRAHEAADDMLP